MSQEIKTTILKPVFIPSVLFSGLYDDNAPSCKRGF